MKYNYKGRGSDAGKGAQKRKTTSTRTVVTHVWILMHHYHSYHTSSCTVITHPHAPLSHIMSGSSRTVVTHVWILMHRYHSYHTSSCTVITHVWILMHRYHSYHTSSCTFITHNVWILTHRCRTCLDPHAVPRLQQGACRSHNLFPWHQR